MYRENPHGSTIIATWWFSADPSRPRLFRYARLQKEVASQLLGGARRGFMVRQDAKNKFLKYIPYCHQTWLAGKYVLHVNELRFKTGKKSSTNWACSIAMFDYWMVSGWWFGTFGLCFPSYWECHHPNWLSYVSEGWLNHQPGMLQLKCPWSGFDLGLVWEPDMTWDTINQNPCTDT